MNFPFESAWYTPENLMSGTVAYNTLKAEYTRLRKNAGKRSVFKLHGAGLDRRDALRVFFSIHSLQVFIVKQQLLLDLIAVKLSEIKADLQVFRQALVDGKDGQAFVFFVKGHDAVKIRDVAEVL